MAFRVTTSVWVALAVVLPSRLLSAETQRINDVVVRSGLVDEQPSAALPKSPRIAVEISLGEAAFNRSCTSCHDAQRALGKQKNYASWLATVQRMATKGGAEIAGMDVVPIARYLTSLGPAGSSDNVVGAGEETAHTAIYAALSPLWRGSNGDHTLENPGFFADVWAGVEWRSNGPFSARLTACTSCHSDVNNSRGFSLEVVEAVGTLDLGAVLDRCGIPLRERFPEWDAQLKAGRMIVPFGAVSGTSHPGTMRTVTLPLMYNMGRRIGPTGPLQPVLPAPYADEGFAAHVSAVIYDDLNASLDFFAVNGLQGNDPSMFNTSRSYVDNNREPAVGGRATVNTSWGRIGGSVMSGNLADEGLPAATYHLAGGDVTWRFQDHFRLYFEYAMRRDDSIFVAGAENQTDGIVVESEVRLLQHPNVGFLTRYDTLEHRHSFFGDSTAKRFTYGLGITFSEGSVLLLNHEHWMLNDGSDADVLGVRWTSVF